MPSLRIGLRLVAAVLVAALMSACTDGDDTPPERLQVEIGVVQSLSGPASIYGTSALRGIELAVMEINRAESGPRISLHTIDDGSSVESGKAAFATLTGEDVTAIIGPTLSNVALQALPTAQQAGVPVLGATLTAAGITEIGDYIFRVALTESVVVPATLARVHQDTPINRAVLIFDSSEAFSRSSADAMRKGIAAIGTTIQAEVDVAKEDLAVVLPPLLGQSPDTLLVTPLVEQSAEIVRAIRSGGFQQTLIGGNGFNTLGIADKAGDAIEGAYVGSAWNPGVDTPASMRFTAAYTEAYGAAPDLFAAQGYSAVYLLLDAVKRAGTNNRASVRDALAEARDLETPLGAVTISAQREAQHEPVVQRFEAGRLVVLR